MCLLELPDEGLLLHHFFLKHPIFTNLVIELGTETRGLLDLFR
jgi:hypothetical protein